MGKRLRKIVKMLIVMLVLLMGIKTTIVSAATVSNVTIEEKVYKASSHGYSWKQYTLLTGRTAAGKKVWTYKTSRCDAVGGRSATTCIKGSSVYIIDDRTFIRLSKQTGKVLAKKKHNCLYGWMGVMAVDSKGNSYSIGKYAAYVVKLDKSGKVKWKKNVSSYARGDYANKMTISRNRLNVYFGDIKLVLNTNNGKVLQYKK